MPQSIGDGVVGVVGGIALLAGLWLVVMVVSTDQIGVQAVGFGVGLVLLVQSALSFHAASQ
ncbi:hypothetical protein ACOZ4N_11650 [Halorientalis pallida]|uniref:hypothetical protein n=1 Tax=Halorientalis pallida TaxID=2479928 RepID=UPI003C7000B0